MINDFGKCLAIESWSIDLRLLEAWIRARFGRWERSSDLTRPQFLRLSIPRSVDIVCCVQSDLLFHPALVLEFLFVRLQGQRCLVAGSLIFVFGEILESNVAKELRMNFDFVDRPSIDDLANKSGVDGVLRGCLSTANKYLDEDLRTRRAAEVTCSALARLRQRSNVHNRGRLSGCCNVGGSREIADMVDERGFEALSTTIRDQ